MTIRYLGHSAFIVKGKSGILLFDPFDPKHVGIPLKKMVADIVLVSNDNPCHNNVSIVKGNPHVIKGPGEYEVKEIMVLGFTSLHDKESMEKNTIYRVEIDGINICHLGCLGYKLSDSQAEELGTVDILMIPTGGKTSLDPRSAAEVVNQISPSVVIPMHYQNVDSKFTEIQELEPVEKFVEAMGAGLSEGEGTVKFNASDFVSDTAEGIKVLVMKQS